jgi:putative ABC transport system permease protein
MRIPLAWLNLRHEKARTAVALAGVMFAVVLVLMQAGFYGSVEETATRVYNRLQFDLLLVSSQYSHLARAGTFPLARLYQAHSEAAVTSTRPVYLGFNLWRLPGEAQRRGIFVIGFQPARPVFDFPDLEGRAAELDLQGQAWMDSLSRPEFGPREPGTEAYVGPMRITIAGTFTLGTGFGADGAILVGDRTFARLFPARSADDISLGLVDVADGADPDAVARRLEAELPTDVRVMTRSEIAAHEREHWIGRTSVGIIFGLGVFVALLVGTAIVYQVLSTDIANRLPEYATLKAMGYGRWYLSRVVLTQAWILAVAGFVPGLSAAYLLYDLTRRYANLPMHLGTGQALGVLGLSIGMCSVSGLISLRKVHSADPADLFR